MEQSEERSKVRIANISIYEFGQAIAYMNLVRQGRLEEARQSLAWLRGGEHCKEEEVEILEVFTAPLPFFTEIFSLNCVGKGLIALFY